MTSRPTERRLDQVTTRPNIGEQLAAKRGKSANAVIKARKRAQTTLMPCPTCGEPRPMKNLVTKFVFKSGRALTNGVCVNCDTPVLYVLEKAHDAKK